jgi:hypothetical protein
MNAKTQSTFLGVALACFGMMPGFAAAQSCRHVGGGILTDFLQPTACSGSFQNLCSDGIAGGDFKGSVGVSVLGVSGNTFQVHHHWVTETGDLIFLDDAVLTTYPTPDANRVLADYLSGINITGGTGAFANASGQIGAFGAVDLKLGELTLRYSGTVCFKPPSQ